MKTAYLYAGTDGSTVPAVPASRNSGQAITAISPAYYCNPTRDVTEIALQVVVLSGNPTYSIEWTIDETTGPDAVFTDSTATWSPLKNWIGLSAAAADIAPELTPVRALRAHVTGGAGTIRVGVLQSGSAG